MKLKLLLVIFFAFFVTNAYADRGVAVESLWNGIHDSNGDPLSAGKVYTYEPGTTTNKATYTDSALVSAAANPIILDSDGKALIFASGSYKFVIKDSSDTTLQTLDNLQYNPQEIVEGELTFGDAESQIIPGTTSFAIRDSSDSRDNLVVAESGDVTIYEDFSFADKEVNGTLFLGASTSDSDDDASLVVHSGGGSGSTRGGQITLYGNEATDPGSVYVTAGNISGSKVVLKTDGSQEIEIKTNNTSTWKWEGDGDYVSQGAYNLDTGTGDLILDQGNVTAAGSIQGDAASLASSGQFAHVNGADGTKGVILSDLVEGNFVIIHNNSASILKLYPPSGGAINEAATDTAVNVAARESVIVWQYNSTSWFGGVLVNF